MTRKRLDQVLVDKGLVETRNRARQAIRLGQVTVDGSPALKPGQPVGSTASLEVDSVAGRYVGRGALKLAAALEEFPVAVAGKVAVDVGASTGGFTDVLLQGGADSVTAVDVGHGQLHPSLRGNERVRVMEGVDIRDASLHEIAGPFDIVVVDLSFISLRSVVGPLERLGTGRADWVVLVKPQFEVGRERVGKRGVVRSASARGDAVASVAAAFGDAGLVVRGAVPSPVPGGSGNREALLWLRRDGDPVEERDLIKVLANE